MFFDVSDALPEKKSFDEFLFNKIVIINFVTTYYTITSHFGIAGPPFTSLTWSIQNRTNIYYLSQVGGATPQYPIVGGAIRT